MANLRVCSVPNCGKKHKALGFCANHFYRLKRHGDPLSGKTPDGEPLRFVHEVASNYQGGDCLHWPFCKDEKGYGLLKVNGKMMPASRYVCTLAHGEPPPKHDAAHSCGKGHLGCVNPNHLSWKTRAANMADKIAHGTRQCGERGTGAKLTEHSVRKILHMKGKTTLREIALVFGVSKSTICAIHKGLTWPNVDRS